MTTFAEFIVTLQIAPDVLVQSVHELKLLPSAIVGAVKVTDVLLQAWANGVEPLPRPPLSFELTAIDTPLLELDGPRLC